MGQVLASAPLPGKGLCSVLPASAAKGFVSIISRPVSPISLSKCHDKRCAGEPAEAGGTDLGEMAGKALATCPIPSAPEERHFQPEGCVGTSGKIALYSLSSGDWH